MLCPPFNGVEKHPHLLSSYALCSRLSFSKPTAPSTGASICCTFAASPWVLLQAGRKTHLSGDPMPSRLFPWQPSNIPTILPRNTECPLAVLANTFPVFRFYCSVILFPFTDCKIPYIQLNWLALIGHFYFPRLALIGHGLFISHWKRTKTHKNIDTFRKIREKMFFALIGNLSKSFFCRPSEPFSKQSNQWNSRRKTYFFRLPALSSATPPITLACILIYNTLFL